MTERRTNPLDAFELRLVRELRAASEPALRTIDGASLARELATLPGGGVLTILRRFGIADVRDRRLITFGGIVLALLAGLVLAVVVGSQHRAPPSDLGHLAYVVDDDVYVADWDGTNPVRVTNAQGDGRSYGTPEWSTDGGLLYFASESSDGTTTEWVTGDDGKTIREVGRPSSPGSGRSLRAADGPRQVRIVDAIEGNVTLYGARLEVTGPDGLSHLIPPPAGYRIWSRSDVSTLSWSPDGLSILVDACTVTPCLKPSEGGADDLFLVPVDGSKPTRLTDHASRPGHYDSAQDRVWNAEISPDGSRIAFIDPTGPTFLEPLKLGLMDLDGSNRHDLVDFGGAFLWSPDGRRIAIASRESANRTIGLWIAGSDGTSVPALLVAGEWRPIAWSGDGTMILAQGMSEANWGLWVINVREPGAKKLVPGAYDGAWQSVLDR